jgi:hypothetical protein
MYTVQLDSPFAASNEAGLTKSYTPNSTPDNKPAQTDAGIFIIIISFYYNIITPLFLSLFPYFLSLSLFFFL